MITGKRKEECCGCMACVNVCPRHCITVKTDSEGFPYPAVDSSKCINCRLCEQVCPFGPELKKTGGNETYAAYNLNERQRFESSSGGIFTLIAEKVIENNGTVYGAAFTGDFDRIVHVSAKNTAELERLKTSKYVQSETGTVFAEIREKLKRGESVLFSGTPCQIAGLRMFLRDDFEKLLCIDVICHGVPSPELWRKYLAETKEKEGEPTAISFRDKTHGWKNFSFFVKTPDSERIESSRENDYMKLFLRNYSLRSSCYQCKIKTNGSMADITLGDLWGADTFLPEMNDDKGLSAIIVHTQKGREMLQGIADCVKIRAIEYDQVSKYNPSLVSSSQKPRDRAFFYADIGRMTIKQLADKYCKPRMTIRTRIGRTLIGKMIKAVIRR